MDAFQVNTLIVEDNLSFALELEMLLKELNYGVAGRVASSGEALEKIYSTSPDLILMDIDIKGDLTGLEIGQKIKHLEIPIIYITSLKDEQHYMQGQESNMIGYLVKPVDKITLRSTIEMAINRSYQVKKKESSPSQVQTQSMEGFSENFISKNAFFFKKRGTYHKVKIDHIAFIKSDDNYCETTTLDGEKFNTRITISKMKELLPHDQFFRTHRQYIVQVQHIDSVDFQDSTVKVVGQEIPLSRSQRKELEQLIKKLD